MVIGRRDLEILVLGDGDAPAAVAVINRAAAWYAEFLSTEEHNGEEMTESEWRTEGTRMQWWGARRAGVLVGVMGAEPVASGNVLLLRHAYVEPEHQRSGVAAALHAEIEARLDPAVRRVIVGTYAANHKARAALTKAGYRQSRDSQAVLREFYDIDEERLRSSVTYERVLSRPQ